jgi:hypothetical protein
LATLFLRLVSGLGRRLVPLGLFALIAVGLHAGADVLDDHALVALDLIDGLVDRVGSALLGWAMGMVGAEPGLIERWTFAFAELIDLDTRDWLAKVVALGFELAGDVVLAVPLFWHRHRDRPWAELGRNLVRDPTVLRVVAPLSGFCAAWAGVLVIAKEVQIVAHVGLEDAGGLAPYAGTGAGVVGLLVLGLVGARLATRVVSSAVCWSDHVGQRDRERGWPVARRRLRGWAVGLVVFPVTVLAVLEAAPPWTTLRALIAGL